MEFKQFLPWTWPTRQAPGKNLRDRQQPDPLFVTKLEERCMLDASFDGTGGVITLDGFDANIKLTIDQSGGDYEFVLSSSSGPPIAHQWNGSDVGSDVVGNGSDTLVVDRDFAIDVIVTGGTNTPDIEFERSDFVQGSGSDDIALSSVGNVTQTGELEVDILTINGATQISLTDQDNDFDSVTIASTGPTAITDTDALALGTTTVTGSFSVVAANDITQTGVVTVSGGVASFESTGGDVLLNNGTQANSLSGGVSLTANGSAELRNLVSTDFTAVDTGTLVLDVTGDITQSTSAWDVNGTAQITVTGDVSLAGQANDFDGTVTFTAAATSDVAIRNVDTSASLGAIPALHDLTVIHNNAAVSFAALNLSGDLNINAAGAISQTGIWNVAGTTTLSATGGAIQLDGQANVLQGNVSLTTTGTSNASIRNDHTTAAFANVDVGGDLSVNATAGGVTQSAAWTVDGTTSVSATGGAIQLDGQANVLQGNVSLTTTGTSHASIRNDHTTAAFATVDVGGDLSVNATAGGVTQSAAWTVDGTTSVSATGGAIQLDGQANVLQGDVSLSTTGTSNASIRNDHTTAGFATVDVGGDLAVNATAGGVTQSAAWAVDGTTSVSATGGAIQLDGQANVLQGNVSLSTIGTSNASIRNDHTTAGFATVDVGGDFTVNATAGGVTQSAAWAVDGTTSVSATGGAIQLDGQANVLQGNVSLATTGTSNASIRNDHTTAGFATVDVGGDFTVNATVGDVTQSAAWDVDGTTNISVTGDVALSGQANDLAGTVTFTAAATSDVAIRNVNAGAALGTISALHDLTVIHNNAAVSFATLNLTGDLDIDAGGAISQTGIWNVAGTTTLSATGGTIQLDGQANVLQGDVSLSTTGTSNASIRNDHTTAGFATVDVGGDLTINATAGGVTQSAAWTVDGTTSVSATGGAIQLDGQANVLQGDVSLSTTGTSNASIRNDHTTAAFAAVDVGGDLSVNATAGDVTQSAAWTVDGTTSVSATGGAIQLGGQANVLQGDVSLSTTGTSNASIRNDHTTAAFANVDVGGDLTVNATTGGVTQSAAWTVDGTTSVSATGGAIQLDGQANVIQGNVSLTTTGTSHASIRNDHTTAAFATVDVGGDLTVNATAGDVTQSAAWDVDGTTNISVTGDVVLSGQANDLAGTVTFTAAATSDVAIRNVNAGAALGTISALHDLTVIHNNAAVSFATLNLTGDLDIDAGGAISQTGIWNVAGTTTLSATGGAIQLDGQANVLQGNVSLATTGTSNAAIRNDHTTAGFATVDVGGDLTVNATAGGVTQSAAWTVDGTTSVSATGGTIQLDGQANVLQGNVSLSTTGTSNASIRNDHTTAAFANVDVGGDLTVNATTGGVTQSAAWTVDGTTSVSATGGAIQLDGQANVIQGNVSLTTTGTSHASIRNDHTTAAFATVDVGGDLTVNATAGDVTQSAAWDVDGTTNISVTGDVVLSGQANDLAGTVTFTAAATSDVAIRNINAGAALGTISALHDLTVIHNNAAVSFATLNLTGDLDIDAAGAISQTGIWNVAGTTTLSATGGAIQLDGQANVLQGDVSLSTTGTSNASIRNDHTTAGFATVDVGGDLTINATAGGVTQSAAWTVDGTTSVSATGGAIQLDGQANVLQGNVSLTTTGTSNASIRNDHTTAAFANVDVGGDLTVNATAGDVTQSAAWTVDGATNISATGGAIQLDGQANVLIGVISLASNTDAAIRNTHTASAFGTVNSGGALSVDVVGDLSQSSAWTSSGATSLKATGNVALASFANQFGGTVTIEGVAATVAAIENASVAAGSYSVVGDLTDLTITNTQTGVTINSFHATNNLVIDSAGDIAQGGIWDVDGNTTLQITSGDVSLASNDNDLSGPVAISASGTVGDLRLRNVSATASLTGVPLNLTNLEIEYTAADVVVPTVTVSDNLTITSLATISASGILNVGQTTSLTLNQANADVSLGAHSHVFDGSVNVAGVGAITLGTIQILNVTTVASIVVDFANSANTIDLDFGGTDITIGTVDVDTLSIRAESSIGQTGLWDVSTATTLEIVDAGTIDVDDFANIFEGTISFVAPAGSSIHYRNASAVVSLPVLPANLHDLSITFDQASVQLPAISLMGNLSVTSDGTIQQSGIWDIDGTTTLELTSSGDVLLGTDGNDFAMDLSVTTSGPAQVGTLNLTNVNASANLAGLPTAVDDLAIKFDNASLSLPQLTVTNGLSLTANGTISQTGAMIVGGSAAFTLTSAGDVLLTEDNEFTTQAPTFAGPISHLHIRDILASATLPSLAALPLTQLTIDYAATPVILPTLAVSGNLTVTAGGSITQTGALDVNNMVLTLAQAGDVRLASSTNTIDGTINMTGDIQDVELINDSALSAFPTMVSSSSLQDVSITHTNNGMVIPNLDVAGVLTLQAHGNIMQTGDITADSLVVSSTTSGANILLTTATNDFGSAIDLGGAATLGTVSFTDSTVDAISFSTSTTTSSLNLDFGGAVDLSSINTTTLTVSSDGITQTGALTVSGNTALTGISSSDVQLASFANDFAGAISIGGLLDDIAIRNVNAAATAPSFAASINSLQLVHDNAAIALSTLSLSGNVVLSSAGSISQTGAFTVGGTSSFSLTSSGDILLAGQANDFSGNVSFTGSVQSLEFRNTNSAANIAIFPTSVDDLVIVFDDAGILLPAISVATDLTLTAADNITQSGLLDVGGNALITLSQPADVLLADFANDIDGTLTIDGSIGDVAIRNASTSAQAPTLNAIADNYTLIHDNVAITLDAMQVNQDLAITSHGTIDETGAVLVGGDSTFIVSSANSSILLNTHANVLDGAITVGTTGAGTLQSVRLQNNVVAAVSFNAPSGLEDLELTMPNATGLALDSIALTGDLDLTTDGSISQTGAWTVAGTSTITSTNGDIQISTESNSLPVVVYSANGEFLLDSSRAVDLTGASADITVSAIGSIVGNSLTTTNNTGAADFTTLGTASITLTNSNFAGGVGAETLSLDGSTVVAADVSIAHISTLMLDSIRTAADATLTANTIESNSGGTNITAAEAVLNATNGIGTAGAIATSVDTITATTVSGDIQIANAGGDLAVRSITAPTGHVVVTNTSGSINDATTDTATDIEATSVQLIATTGIGAASQLEVATSTLFADTDANNLNIVNTAPSAVSATRLNSGTANVIYTQTGGFALTVDDADANSGNVQIATDGQITATQVNANGTASLRTTGTSRNVFVRDILANDIDITATGRINGVISGVQLASSFVQLNAGNGIGNTQSIGVTATTIDAATNTGDVILTSFTRGSAVTVTGLTTGSGDIEFDQDGASSLQVSGTRSSSGDISITADSQMRIVNAQADGGDISLETASGDVAIGFVSADDDIVIRSDGGVTELTNDTNVDIVADGVLAITSDGFGASGDIETNIEEIEIVGGTGNVNFTNAGALRIGGFSNPHGISTTGTTNVEATSIVVGKGINSSGGNNVTLNATAGAISVNSAIQISGGLGIFKGTASGAIAVSGSGSITTPTGSVREIPSPVVATALEQDGSTISATGEAEIDVTIRDTGSNYKITVDWQDGISEETDVVGGTTHRFQHTYSPDLNIESTVEAVVTIELDFRDGAENGIQLTSTSEELGLSKKVALDPPAQGIIGSVGVLVDEPAIIVSNQTLLATAPKELLSPIDAIQTVEVTGGSSTSVSAPEKQLILRVISPAGDEGEDVSLSLEDLNDLPSLYERLPDNRYRIYLITEDGNARLIVDVQLRDGRPVDPSATDDEQPERPAVKLAIQADDRADSESINDQPATGEDTAEGVSDIALPKAVSRRTTITTGVESTTSKPVSTSSDPTPSNEDSAMPAVAGSLLAGSAIFLKNKRARAIRRSLNNASTGSAAPRSFSKSARRLRSIRGY